MSIEGVIEISPCWSTGFEQKDCNLSHVEIDEMFRLMGHVRSEVPSNNAVPGWVVFFVELFLDVCGDVLLDVELLKGLGGDVDGILLHVCQLGGEAYLRTCRRS